jgi:hypothetical protein
MFMAKTAKSKAPRKIVVRRPATRADYIRIYGVKNGLLKEVEKLEKALCPA